MDEGVLGGEQFEFVNSRDEWVSRLLGQISSNGFCETSVGVKSGSNSSAALSNLVYMFKCLLHAHMIPLEHRHIGTEFLTQGQWRGIHQVSTSDFDNVGEFISFAG